MRPKTADLCDVHAAEITVAEPLFREYGAVAAFHGPVETLRLYEDNLLLRQTVEMPGEGRVLVIDGGGSRGRALIGGNVANLAQRNGWAGLLIHGSVRDIIELAEVKMGIRALASNPMPPRGHGYGERGVVLRFAGVTIAPGAFVYADEDGIIVTGRDLTR